MRDRRRFIAQAGALLLAALGGPSGPAAPTRSAPAPAADNAEPAPGNGIRLFLCGDVMTGRGIDQVLPYSCPPLLYEPYLRDARDYVRLAEQVNGPVPAPVDFGYVWGDALDVLAQAAPDLRVINLETAVTARGRPWPKGINYRMHPANMPVLTEAAVDCCVLANNHVLDWGPVGLTDTLAALTAAGIAPAGAGVDDVAARAPAILDVPGRGRVLVFACGSTTSGVADAWAAAPNRPGVNLLPDLSPRTVSRLAAQVAAVRQPGDIAVASIHWGGNWGYPIPRAQRDFAHALIDDAGIDLVHGHSSHHPKGIEVHRGRLILYGCGDLLNDYEGIRGQREYRPELGLMYFPSVDPATGRLQRLMMAPTRLRRLRLQRADAADAQWLADRLSREGGDLGTGVDIDRDGRLSLTWASGPDS